MAKFFLTIFAVLAATQILPSSGSCLPCPIPPVCGGSSVGYSSGPYVSGPGGYPGPYYGPGAVGYGPNPASDCYVPPVYVPPPTFPNLPTIHAPRPLTIPLQVPSVIPVGKVCVCKAIQIQPSVVPAPKPIYNCGCGKDVIIPGPAPCQGHGHPAPCGC